MQPQANAKRGTVIDKNNINMSTGNSNVYKTWVKIYATGLQQIEKTFIVCNDLNKLSWNGVFGEAVWILVW